MTPSPAAIIRRLYRGTSPYKQSPIGPEGRRLRRARGQTYGELAPAGIADLITHTGLKEDDYFIDIGSGAGKVVISIVLLVPGVTALGIEIDTARHTMALNALAMAESKALIPRNRARFLHADAGTVNLTGGTVFFACSTCFPQRLMNRLARKIAALPTTRVFVSLTELPPRVAACFASQEDHACTVSWSPYARFYLYWTSPLTERS